MINSEDSYGVPSTYCCNDSEFIAGRIYLGMSNGLPAITEAGVDLERTVQVESLRRHVGSIRRREEYFSDKPFKGTVEPDTNIALGALVPL